VTGDPAREVERLLLAHWETLPLAALHWMVGTLLAARGLREPGLPVDERTELLATIGAAARAMEVVE
jgi:hypothetical protein